MKHVKQVYRTSATHIQPQMLQNTISTHRKIEVSTQEISRGCNTYDHSSAISFPFSIYTQAHATRTRTRKYVYIHTHSHTHTHTHTQKKNKNKKNIPSPNGARTRQLLPRTLGGHFVYISHHSRPFFRINPVVCWKANIGLRGVKIAIRAPKHGVGLKESQRFSQAYSKRGNSS
jgi:hypothetical protein